MKGCFENRTIYQTLAEPGESYPALPTFTNTSGSTQYFSSDMNDVQSVWYVKELTNVKYDTSQAVPEITATDTGRRHYAFNIANGPVLGSFAQTRGMARTYFREGTYLSGFWHNGQLFVMPLMEGFGCDRCDKLRIQKGITWEVTVPAVDDYWIKMSQQAHSLTDGTSPLWLSSATATDGSSYTELTEITGTATHGYEHCRAGKQETDTSYLGIGDDALADYEGSPYYGTPGTIFEDPWQTDLDKFAVYLRYKGINRQVILQATVNTTAYAYASYVFTALYEKPFKKCFPDTETYSRTSICVSEYDGGQVTIIPTGVTDVRTNYTTQLPTSVTVRQVS